MMKNILLVFMIMFCMDSKILGQRLGITFQEAEQQGISIQKLDSIYKSAVHSDTSLAVFKTKPEEATLQQAYIQLLQDLGKFLSLNNFKWDKATRCFNRIYFNAEGNIDYFLFNFLGKTAEEKPSEQHRKEFQRLLNLFIKDYKFALSAKVKFAQCSPVTYKPQ